MGEYECVGASSKVLELCLSEGIKYTWLAITVLEGEIGKQGMGRERKGAGRSEIKREEGRTRRRKEKGERQEKGSRGKGGREKRRRGRGILKIKRPSLFIIVGHFPFIINSL